MFTKKYLNSFIRIFENFSSCNFKNTLPKVQKPMLELANKFHINPRKIKR